MDKAVEAAPPRVHEHPHGTRDVFDGMDYYGAPTPMQQLRASRFPRLRTVLIALRPYGDPGDHPHAALVRPGCEPDPTTATLARRSARSLTEGRKGT